MQSYLDGLSLEFPCSPFKIPLVIGATFRSVCDSLHFVHHWCRIETAPPLLHFPHYPLRVYLLGFDAFGASGLRAYKQAPLLYPQAATSSTQYESLGVYSSF